MDVRGQEVLECRDEAEVRGRRGMKPWRNKGLAKKGGGPRGESSVWSRGRFRHRSDRSFWSRAVGGALLSGA